MKNKRDAKAILVLSVLGLFLAAGAFTGPATAGDREADSSLVTTDFRIGFTEGVFGGYNKDDAIAAIGVWFKKIVLARNIPISPVIELYENGSEMKPSGQGANVDLMGLQTDEYLPFKTGIKPDQIFGVMRNGVITEEYLLLTRAGDPYTRLEDLQGRSIIFLDTADAALARVWLDTILMQGGFPCSAEYFGHVERCPRVSRTMLPVFFGKVDACVVTRAAFETMSELNPQVGQVLRSIAASPPLVPAVICFRSGYDRTLTKEIVAGLLDLHQDPHGQQVLLIFGSDKIVRVTPEELETVRVLLDEYEQLVIDLPSGG